MAAAKSTASATIIMGGAVSDVTGSTCYPPSASPFSKGARMVQ